MFSGRIAELSLDNTMLAILHRIGAPGRMKSKLAVRTHRRLHGIAPQYLSVYDILYFWLMYHWDAVNIHPTRLCSVGDRADRESVQLYHISSFASSISLTVTDIHYIKPSLTFIGHNSVIILTVYLEVIFT